MQFLKTIINKISPGMKKGIGIFISQSSTMEMVEYDYDMGEIINYSKLDFEYDSILREVNIENFEVVLQNIIKKFDISQHIPITLTIPSIFINIKTLPTELESEEVQTALISETEKNYLFKKSEPVVSWNTISIDKENQLNTIIYSALQKHFVEKIENVFKRQGLKLVALETSYAAFIRGLSVTGLVDDCIENNLSWCVFLIKNNSNAAIILKGSQVLNVIESPLALKSIETDDLYPTLSASFLEKIQDTKVETLAIVNYSKIVDSKELSACFDFNCPVIKIENNYCKGDPLFVFALDKEHSPINPEVIGAACWKNAPVKFGFNFLGSQGQEEMPGFLASLGIAGNPLHVILLGLITVAFLLITAISLIALPINASLDDQYKQVYVKCSQYQEKFDKPQTKVFNLFDVVQTGFTNNEKIITSYDAVSAVIPEKVWITSIAIDEDLNASIQGKAYSIEDIVRYYENLLSVSKFNNLKIKSIKVVGETSGLENNTPDVSVNPTGNNPNMQPGQSQDPYMNNGQPQQNGSSMLPPPPSAGAVGTSIASIAGPKYYEFDFGNPIEVKKEDDKTTAQTKGFIPNISDLSKNINLGH